MLRTDSNLASLLLVNRLVDSGAEPLGPKEYWRLIGQVGEPSRLLEMGSAEIGELLPGIDGARIRTLLDASTQLAFELERLDRTGIRVLSPFDDGYPQRLRDRLGGAAPPILHVVGPLELLEADGLGIVGSRNITPDAERIAVEAARLAAEQGLSTISGAAKGTDITAMGAAFDAGGTVVGILADPLDRKLRQPDIRRAIGEDRLTLASPFKPGAGFSVAGAMSRNKVIYASSKVTLVVASDHQKGGTWQGATEALRKGYGGVAVWQGPGEGPGNRHLVSAGSTAVGSVEELRGLLLSPESQAQTAGPDQLSFGL